MSNVQLGMSNFQVFTLDAPRLMTNFHESSDELIGIFIKSNSTAQDKLSKGNK